jgi:hypothetical protein
MNGSFSETKREQAAFALPGFALEPWLRLHGLRDADVFTLRGPESFRQGAVMRDGSLARSRGSISL